jgi:hypothetical protein
MKDRSFEGRGNRKEKQKRPEKFTSNAAKVSGSPDGRGWGWGWAVGCFKGNARRWSFVVGKLTASVSRKRRPRTPARPASAAEPSTTAKVANTLLSNLQTPKPKRTKGAHKSGEAL